MKMLILAVLLAVIQASVPVPRKAANPSDRTPQNVKNYSGSDKTPPQRPPTVENPISTDPDKYAGHTPTTENTQKSVVVTELPPVSVTKDRLDKIYIAFTGILICVGGFGVLAAYRTLRVIEKQTQALVDSERARVFVKAIKRKGAPETGRATFTIRAKNYGRVPARIVTSIYTEIALQFPDQELKTPPRYDNSILFNEKFLEPRAKHIIVEFDPFSEINNRRQLSDPASKIVIYGRIEYFDGMSNEKRETRFALSHVRQNGSQIGGQVIRCGPREYNLYT